MSYVSYHLPAPSVVPGDQGAVQYMLTELGVCLAPPNHHMPSASFCLYLKYNQVSVKHFQFCIQQVCLI